MGHKVHPNAFRLGVFRPWEANWFANRGNHSIGRVALPPGAPANVPNQEDAARILKAIREAKGGAA